MPLARLAVHLWRCARSTQSTDAEVRSNESVRCIGFRYFGVGEFLERSACWESGWAAREIVRYAYLHVCTRLGRNGERVVVDCWVCYAAWMGHKIVGSNEKWGGSAGGWLGLVLAVANGCGGKAKDDTRETSAAGADASLDAGGSWANGDAAAGDGGTLGSVTHDSAGLGSGATTAGGNDTDGTNTASTTATTPPNDTTPTATSAATTSGAPLRPGWVPVESIAESLSNCSGKLEENNNWCSYQTLCGTVKLNSRCERDGDEWQCTCELGDNPRSYGLAGVEDVSACVASLAVCSPDRKPDPTPVCSVEVKQVSVDECKALEVCHTTAALDDGLTATVVDEYALNECAADPDTGNVYCQCLPTGGLLRVDDLPLDQTCGALVSACDAGLPASGEGLSCSAEDFIQRADYCSLVRECGEHMNLGEGHALIGPTPQQVACSDDAGCECLGTHTLSLNASGELDEDRCEIAEEFCHGGVTVSPAEAVSLVGIQTQGAASSCESSATASQWMSWDTEKSVQLTGPLGVDCTRDSDEWQCTCVSGSNSSPAFMASGANANAVCEDALELCAARGRMSATNAADYAARAAFEFLPESFDDADQ